LCRATVVEHELRQLAAARGEKPEWLKAEGQMLGQLMRNSVDCTTIQHGTTSWTWRRS
jgi:hypothetical protein